MRCAWVVTLVLVSGAARAEDGPAWNLVERAGACGDSTFCIPGWYKFRYRHLSDFAVDADGAKHGALHFGEHLWRLRPRINMHPAVYLEAEADLVTGRLFMTGGEGGVDRTGHPLADTDAFGRPPAASFRQLYLSYTSPIGLFRIGQQTSRYGLGVIANGGDDEEHDVFDDPRLGDIVERVVFATQPLRMFSKKAWARSLILAGGFDVVYHDDNADLVDGDLALQGVVSLMWRTRELTAGFYMAFRNQEDKDGDTLKVQAYDVYVSWVHEFQKLKARLRLAAEVAVITGRTNRAVLEQAREGVDILGVGGAFQASFLLHDLGLETRLEVGFASGDNDRNDDLVRSFSFDPDYHVGMILFQEVMARISARSVVRASDPKVLAQPPKGVELVATDGSITNAVYLNPVIRYRAPFGLRADLGVLAAWSVADVIDPWASALQGGYNYNYLGNPATDHYLGVELDVG